MRGTGAEKADESNVLRAEDTVPGYGDEGVPGPPADVPQYDLGQQLMSDHRRVSAARRKGPGLRGEAPARSVEPRAARQREHILRAETPEQRQVVTDIVARDIEELRRASRPSPDGTGHRGHALD